MGKNQNPGRTESNPNPAFTEFAPNTNLIFKSTHNPNRIEPLFIYLLLNRTESTHTRKEEKKEKEKRKKNNKQQSTIH